jgi:hypothetical protein
MIYAIGNSHAHFFTNSHPADTEGRFKNEYFTSYSLGPTIAYNFYEHHLQKIIELIQSNKINIFPSDHILLVVGEVDCRWHLPKQAEEQKRNVQDIVNECIDRFFKTHLFLKQNGYNVISWGGHPSTIAGHNDDLSSPVYGDCLYRNKISKEWDSYLKYVSLINSIPNISIIHDLIDENGLTKMEYFIDYCHLNHSKLFSNVFNKFKEKNLIK